MPSISDHARGVRYGVWLALVAVTADWVASGLASGLGLALVVVLPADRMLGVVQGCASIAAQLGGLGVLLWIVTREIEPEDAQPSPLTLVAVGGAAVVGWMASSGGGYLTPTLAGFKGGAANLGDYYAALSVFHLFGSLLRVGGTLAVLTLAWLRARPPRPATG